MLDCFEHRSISPTVQNLARAAREDLQLRASVTMQVLRPGNSAGPARVCYNLLEGNTLH